MRGGRFRGDRKVRWSTANQISLGQVVVDAKSNEITAIPKLLELLEFSGSLVTIDALGCQTKIAQRIVNVKADYCLAVKKNQPTLHETVVNFFADHLDDDFARVQVRQHQTEEKSHGREVIASVGLRNIWRTVRVGRA